MRAASPVSPVANMAVKSAAAPSKAPSLASYQSSLKIPRNTKFKVGQFKGKTFWEILHRHPDYFPWTLKNAKSPRTSKYAEWLTSILSIGEERCIVRIVGKTLHQFLGHTLQTHRERNVPIAHNSPIRGAQCTPSKDMLGAWSCNYHSKGLDTQVCIRELSP